MSDTTRNIMLTWMKAYAMQPAEYWFGNDDDVESVPEEFIEEWQGDRFDTRPEILDIKYIVNYLGEVQDVRLTIAFGGPSIWMDTESRTIEGRWWAESASVQVDDDVDLNAVVDYHAEFFHML